MVDIHSHILPGVDDGAPSLDISLAMLRLAAQHGTTDIVATPHANSNFPFDPALLTSRFDELAATHTGLPRIHRACDFHLSATNIRLALDNPTPYTVNGGRYLMVEFPEMFHVAAMDEVLRQFTANGVICVITHPERNPVIRKSPDILARWIHSGCLSQITAMSLTGGFGPDTRTVAWKMLRDGLCHFVASDGHDLEFRPPVLDAARCLLDQEISPDLATLLVLEHPRAVIENRIMPMEITVARRARKWYQFW